jgi:hypothetical protein
MRHRLEESVVCRSISSSPSSFAMLTNFATTYSPNTLFTTENATSILDLYPILSDCIVFLDNFALFLLYHLTISTYTGVDRIAKNQGLPFAVRHISPHLLAVAPPLSPQESISGAVQLLKDF